VNVTGIVAKARGLNSRTRHAMRNPKEEWIDSGVRPEKPLG